MVCKHTIHKGIHVFWDPSWVLITMVCYGMVRYGMVWYGMVWPSNSKEMFKHSNQGEHGNQDQVWCVNIQYIREYMFSEVHRGF